MPDAATYRIKAVEMRERAKSARDRVAHQELLNLAAQYEALANHIQTLDGWRAAGLDAAQRRRLPKPTAAAASRARSAKWPVICASSMNTAPFGFLIAWTTKPSLRKRSARCSASSSLLSIARLHPSVPARRCISHQMVQCELASPRAGDGLKGLERLLR
jgi:hypothetical protein